MTAASYADIGRRSGATARTPSLWINRFATMQRLLFGAWFAFATLFPPNLGTLALLVLLLPLWLIGGIVGVAHWWRHRSRGWQVLELIALPVAALMALQVLDAITGLPVVSEPLGTWLFIAGLIAWPAWHLWRWAQRSSKQSEATGIPPKPGMLLLAAASWLVLHIGFLVWSLVNPEAVASVQSVMGSGWWEHSLWFVTIGTAVTAGFGWPYALFGLLKANGSRWIYAALLGLTTLLVLVLAGLWLAILALMYG